MLKVNISPTERDSQSQPCHSSQNIVKSGFYFLTWQEMFLLNLHWPCVDCHIDMETLRAIVDPQLRDKLAREKDVRNHLFGKSVAIIRKQYKLRQVDINKVQNQIE